MEAGQLDIVKIILDSGFVVKSVLVLLILSSVVSWAIVLFKKKTYSNFAKNNQDFINIYRNSKDLSEVSANIQNIEYGPFKAMFVEGYKELQKVNEISSRDQSRDKLREHFKDFGLGIIQRAIKKGQNDCIKHLEKNLSTLASIGSVTPFVGLFGTVWGIIDSFTGLASGGATLDAVAPGIAEALVATAVGLAAAIPAVWFFNYFNTESSKIHTDMESFEQELINVVERSVF